MHVYSCWHTNTLMPFCWIMQKQPSVLKPTHGLKWLRFPGHSVFIHFCISCLDTWGIQLLNWMSLVVWLWFLEIVDIVYTLKHFFTKALALAVPIYHHRVHVCYVSLNRGGVLVSYRHFSCSFHLPFYLKIFTIVWKNIRKSCLVQFRIAALMQEPSFVLMTIIFWDVLSMVDNIPL